MIYRLLSHLDETQFELFLLTQEEDELSRRLRLKDGVQVDIIPPRGLLKHYDNRLLDVPFHRKVGLGGRILQYNVDARKYLRSADIIWCENVRDMTVLSPYILLSRTPVIWNVGLGETGSGFVDYLQRLALVLSDYVFIESEEQAERVFGERFNTYRDKFVIFHKGIDTEKFDPERVDTYSAINRTPIENPAIGTAATITPRKGLEDLIKALPYILKVQPAANLYIAGGLSNELHEEYKSELTDLAKELEIEDSVYFLGWVDEMPEFLAGLDVFVLPSYNEGISGAVREALAMKTPVVSSDVGGMSDVVIEDETGFLIHPGDVDELASAVIGLLEDQDLRSKMGKNGRELIVTEFSIEGFVGEYRDLLTRVYHDNY